MSRKAASWPNSQLFLDHGGGGAPMTVVHDGSLTGSGVTGDPLRVANPFTDADETKLDGIEANAEQNVQPDWNETDSSEDSYIRNRPLHIIRFAAQDAGTFPATHLSDGEIGFYDDDGSTQHQSGDVAGLGTIYLPKRGAAFGQDATNPDTDLTANAVSLLGEDLVRNAGSDCIVALTAHGTTDTVWFQASLIEVYGTTGYKLTSIQHLKGSHTPASYGVSWNVVVALTHGVAVSDIIDAVGKLVFRTDLEGHETDLHASYTNGLINSGYASGSWSLFSGTNAPSGSGIGQPDIASGSGVAVFGRLRTDRDPNKLVWGPVPAAGDYPSGRVIHAYVEGSNNPGHVRITLTGDGTLVGTGDAAYVWAPASWVEVGDVGPVDEGNWWRLSEYEPSDLDIRIPAADIIDPPWMERAGAGTGDTAVAQASYIPVRSPTGEYEDKSVAHMGDHIRPQITAPRVLSATYETTAGDVDAGDGLIHVGAISGGSATVTWGIRDSEAIDGGGDLPKADIQAILTLHHRITIYAGSKVFKGSITGYGGGSGSYPYQLTVSGATLTGNAFTDAAAMKVKLESAIVDRDEFAEVAFSGELTDLEGVPDVPAANGTYKLRATRSNTGVTFSWVTDL